MAINEDIRRRFERLAKLKYGLQGNRKPLEGGKPLVSHEVIVSLIQATKTREGLKVRAALDKCHYPKGS